MKHMTLILIALALVACGGGGNKQQQEIDSEPHVVVLPSEDEAVAVVDTAQLATPCLDALDNPSAEDCVGDSDVAMQIHEVELRGMTFRFEVSPAEGFSGWEDVRLVLTRNGNTLLDDVIGRVSYFECDVEGFFPEAENGIVSTTDAILFFADVDFDGEKEIVSGLRPFAGSQRDCSAYCSIYKLSGGRYVDMYDEFTSKSELFTMLDIFAVSIDYEARAIYHGNIAGVNRYVSVYSFSNGDYIYEGRAECRCSPQSDEYEVVIFDSSDVEVERSHVEADDIEAHWLGCLRDMAD